jgi:hypothetical protein
MKGNKAKPAEKRSSRRQTKSGKSTMECNTVRRAGYFEKEFAQFDGGETKDMRSQMSEQMGITLESLIRHQLIPGLHATKKKVARRSGTPSTGRH